MSLTKFLKEKDVKRKFQEFFPKPQFTVKKEILAPPITKNYSLVGTTFDYLLRFLIEYSYDQTISNSWVAESSLKFLEILIEAIQKQGDNELSRNPESKLFKLFHSIEKYNDTKNNEQKVKFIEASYNQVDNIILNAKKNHSEFLSNGQITENLIESAILLAQADVIYRANIIDKNLGNINKDDIKDLKNLISLVNLKNFKLKNICFVNPHFGKASIMIGGADADLIIDDMLIEIKTTKILQMKREVYDQLIGYYTLYRIGGINGMSENNEIDKLGVYFSRYGYLHLYDIEDIIDETKFPEFIEWFKERASRQYGELSQNIFSYK